VTWNYPPDDRPRTAVEKPQLFALTIAACATGFAYAAALEFVLDGHMYALAFAGIPVLAAAGTLGAVSALCVSIFAPMNIPLWVKVLLSAMTAAFIPSAWIVVFVGALLYLSVERKIELTLQLGAPMFVCALIGVTIFFIAARLSGGR